MSYAEREARLLRNLATEVEELQALERFSLNDGRKVVGEGAVLAHDVKVTFVTPYAYNPAGNQKMEAAVAQLVAEGIAELVQSAVARQRETVQQCREALTTFHAQPKDVPLAKDEVEGQQANRGDQAAQQADDGRVDVV
jgi:hypothetical protein